MTRSAAIRALFRPQFRFWFLAILIAVTCLLLQSGALRNGEVEDDHVLLHSAAGRGCGTAPLSCFQHPLFGLYYRPMMAATFAATVGLHGPSPLYAHIESLALYAADILLAIWLYSLLFRRRRPALIAGTLFGLHPIQVGAATWIGGRTDLLALFFSFWYATALIKAGQGRWRVVWFGVALLAFAAALLSKEQCFLLALLAPMLLSGTRQWAESGAHESKSPGPPLPQRGTSDRGKGRGGLGRNERSGKGAGGVRSRGLGELGLSAVPFLGLIVAFFAVARSVIPKGAIDTAPWDAALRIEMVGRTIWYYAKVLPLPTLKILHEATLGPWSPPQLWIMFLGFFAGGLWLALLAGIWENRVLRLLALWTTLTLAPCLNVIPIPSQFIASYRAMLPMFGFVGLVGWALDWGMEGLAARQGARIVSAAAFAGIACWYACVSILDVQCWHGDLAMETSQFRADPNFLPALAGASGSLRQEGRNAEALQDLDLAVSMVFGSAPRSDWVAMARSPVISWRVKSLSSLRYRGKEFSGGLVALRGGAEQALGRWDSGAADFRIAVAINPDDFPAREALAECDIGTGRLWEAEETYQRLIAQSPTAFRLARLGYIYTCEGQWSRALDVLMRARAQPSIDPTLAYTRTPAYLRSLEQAEQHKGRDAR